jgi:ATP-binding cassette subfamily F protein uup
MADAAPTLLTALDLGVRYNEHVILDGASLTIREGEHVGLVGRNGSGKSTFLKILAGQQTADRGEITRRRGMIISYLSQEFTLDPAKTVYP